VFILGVGDLHQNNLLLMRSNAIVGKLVMLLNHYCIYLFLGIDFGFIQESPMLDTSDFPIPICLKHCFNVNGQWANFKVTFL
jgi:hypothetical protein